MKTGFNLKAVRNLFFTCWVIDCQWAGSQVCPQQRGRHLLCASTVSVQSGMCSLTAAPGWPDENGIQLKNCEESLFYMLGNRLSMGRKPGVPTARTRTPFQCAGAVGDCVQYVQQRRRDWPDQNGIQPVRDIIGAVNQCRARV